jgi:hypothetical protein
MITHTCKQCATQIPLPDKAAGRKFRCPKCSTLGRVHKPDEEVLEVPEGIRFHCPKCRRSYKSPDRLAGKRLTCQGCKAELVIPKSINFDEVAAELASGSKIENEQPNEVRWSSDLPPLNPRTQPPKQPIAPLRHRDESDAERGDFDDQDDFEEDRGLKKRQMSYKERVARRRLLRNVGFVLVLFIAVLIVGSRTINRWERIQEQKRLDEQRERERERSPNTPRI